MSDVTRILAEARSGNPAAAEQLLPLVYEELRRLAAHKMAREASGNTLQATALVHEAWLRLVGDEQQGWDGRTHFFAAAAEAMRRILVERGRHKRAACHGGHLRRVEMAEADYASPGNEDHLLAVNDALDRLAREHRLEAELVKLRYFVGMSQPEAAEALGIAPRTARNYWTHARAWLFREIGTGRGDVRRRKRIPKHLQARTLPTQTDGTQEVLAVPPTAGRAGSPLPAKK